MTSPITAPAGSPPAAITREKFLAAIRAANLFAPMQLQKVEASVPATAASAVDAARALIAAGHLTKFQAERLLAGRSDGFHLGPYVVLDQVGRGPMGRVYKARHQTMNRPVAVKVLAANLTDTPAARQAIQQGVRAAAQLNHSNVVTAYDANEINTRFYLVVELVDGPDLEALVKERGALPIAEACELLWQAASGLEHAHARKMLHHDLKPTNLLVSRPSKTAPELLLKIADFGVSKFSPTAAAAAQTPAPGSWLGTADYTSPELTNHPEHADKPADLYSLGAIGYFLLTGQPPFPGGTVDEKAKRHLWEEPARLELVRPDTPPALAALLHQMLAKNPVHRPGSAAEVVARLENVLATFGDSISFDLPQQQGGQYSFVAGQLSGVMAAPPSSGHYPVPPGSGYHPVPGSGYHPVPVPHDQTPSPPVPMSRPQPAPARAANPNLQSWSQIAAAKHSEEADDEPPRRYGRPAQGGGKLTTLIVIALTVAAFAGMAWALKVYMK